MSKKNTQRVHLDLSKAQFNLLKRWAINLPHGRTHDDFILLLMDAQQDYLKRVATHVRAKNPQPKIPKRPPENWEIRPVEVEGTISQIGREDNENTRSGD